MTPDELLRWLRARLGLSQERLALALAAHIQTVGVWEAGPYVPSPRYRAQLAALLAPHLATPEGEAFARSLGRGEG